MPKIKILSLFACILLICPAAGLGVDVMEINVGDKNSASWNFTVRFSQLWRQKYPEEESKFEPRYVANVNNRFENLQKRISVFVIAPLKSIGESQLNEMKIKVVAALWKTFLVGFGLGEPEMKNTPAAYKEWFVPKNSVMIPTVFHSSSKLYNNPKIIEVESEGLDEIYEFEGALFFEIIGSINDLYKSLGKKLNILKMDARFINILLRRHSWLEAFQLSEPQINTVSLTMALFAHESEDSKLIKKTLNTLLYPPPSIFPRSHIIKNLSASETSRISSRLLRPESLKYFKSR